MPTVPKYDTPQVEPTGFLNVQATPQSFGASLGQEMIGIGKGLESLSDVAEKHALKLQERANQAAAKDAFANATEELGQMEAQYRSLQGKNAVEAHGDYVKNIKGLRDKYLGQFSNAEARRIFDQDFTRRVGFTIVDAAHHAATQNRQYNIKSNQSVAESAAEDAARSPDNTRRVEEARRVGIDAVRNIARERGLGDEELKLAERKYSSSLDLNRIMSTARTDQDKAEEYLKHLGSGMLQDDIEKAEDTIKKQRNQRTLDYERGFRILQHEMTRASDQSEDKFIKDIFSPTPKASVQDILDDQSLTRPARERLIGVYNRATKEEPLAQRSNTKSTELIERMRRPEGDPLRINSADELTQAYIAGDLNKADLAFTRKEFAEMRTPENESLVKRKSLFMTGIKHMIDKSTLGKPDEGGPQRAYEFEVYLDKKIQQYRKEGKDPFSLLDPASPDYQGKKEILQKFGPPTLQEEIRAKTQRLQRRPATAGAPEPPKATPQREPGETLEAYRKRTGIGQ